MGSGVDEECPGFNTEQREERFRNSEHVLMFERLLSHRDKKMERDVVGDEERRDDIHDVPQSAILHKHEWLLPGKEGSDSKSDCRILTLYRDISHGFILSQALDEHLQ